MSCPGTFYPNYCGCRSLPKQDSAGRLPLHMAVSGGGASREVVASLVKAHADGVRHADHKNLLPLAYAVASEAPADVVESLIGITGERMLERTLTRSRADMPQPCTRFERSVEAACPLCNWYSSTMSTIRATGQPDKSQLYNRGMAVPSCRGLNS